VSGAGSHRIEYHWTRPLVIRYYGPTAGGKGARCVVRDDSDGRRVTVPYRYDLSTCDRLTDAVTQWIEKHGEGLPSAYWAIVSTSSVSWLAVPLVGRAVVSDDHAAMLVEISERWRGVTL
jgi:hypothetical protein